jgi:hypothetical protein
MNQSTDKHLHLVSFDVPWPANYGGVIDVYFKLKALAEHGVKIHLHCFEYGRKPAPVLNDLCTEVQYYKRDISKRHLFRQQPYIVSSRTSEQLVSNLLHDDYPILLEGLHTCQLIEEPRLGGRKISVRTHNVEHEYYLHLAKAEPGIFKKYYFYNESAKLKKFEPILSKAAAIIAISQKDERYFSAHYDNVHFVPAFHPHREPQISNGKGTYALYHGNLSVAENFNAVKYLATKVFNDLKTPFKVAGLNPPAHLVKLLAPIPNIELIENPSDAELFQLIHQAHINVSVTFQATGLKLKLLNTLYNGRFCLVNEPMLSGTALDELCVVANEPEAMKAAVKELFRKSFTAREIALRKEKLDVLYHNGNNVEKLIRLVC